MKSRITHPSMINNTAIAQNLVPTQILFIDAQVEDLQLLAKGVIPGIKTVILEGDRDGIEQITEVLRQEPYSTIHLVSHGSPGCLYLGNTELSLDTLNTYQSELKTWFNIPPFLRGARGDRNLLLYGCNVAAGDAGSEFITKLHNITGAEIAASTTPIGNVAKGGNWNFDYQTAATSSVSAFTAQARNSYAGILGIYENTDNETVTTGNTVTKTFNVAENLVISEIDLGLNAEHSYRGDLRVTLTSPNNTSVQLISASTDTDDNYDLLLTDNSSNAIDRGQNEDVGGPIYEFDYQAAPSNPLSAFTGENSAGTWTLTIDNLSGTASNGRNLTYNSSKLRINNPIPWEVNSANGGILVRGASFISCGTLAANGLSSPVLAVDRIDIDANGNPVIPASGEAAVANPLTWSHRDWTQEKLGNVYGLAIDGDGNMFATASANHGSGYGFNGIAAQINYGSVGRDAGGELGAAGTIYKMDAVSGAPIVFAQLPQQETTVTNIDSEVDFAPDVVRQTGPGLGNIHHDKVNDQFFVSNFEDGRIYRLDSNGNILDSYDPGTLDNGSAGAPPISELVYGLTVSPDGSKLFYGQNKTVYSIDLNADGSLPGTINNAANIAGATWDNYTGATETLQRTIPNVDPNDFVNSADIIISDLEFLPDGNLMVGARVYSGKGNLVENTNPIPTPTIFSSYNHGGSVYTLAENGGTFSDLTELQGYSTVTQDTGNDDGYGGVSYSQNLDGSFDYVVSSGDIIDEKRPHGIAVFPDNFNVEFVQNPDDDTPDANEIVPRGAISYGLNGDFKGVGGDVNVFNPGVIRGNVSEDTTGNNNGDTPISGVTLSLRDSDGNAVQVIDPNTGNLVNLTTTTDVDGDYEFNNLLAGTYSVVETQPSGLFNVSENEGGDDNDHTDDGTVNSIKATVVLGEFDVGNDFVETATPPVPIVDYGDAPDTVSGSATGDYQTTEADGGASHVLDEENPITIGDTVDGDDGTQQNPDATADGADEDGVTVSGTNDSLNGQDIPAVSGNTYSVDVVVNTAAAAAVVNNPNAATISGIAYRDYDLDGAQNPATTSATGQAGGEPGLGGVTVNAYDADNNLVTTTTTSNDPATIGEYTLNIPANQQSQLRLEFLTPDGFEAGGSGTEEGDLTRFIDTSGGAVTDVDLALNRPEQYYSATNQANPFVVVPCFVFGDQENGTFNTDHTLVTFKYDGSSPDANPIYIADANEVGTVYGLAYERTGQNIYTSAFTKRHSGYGPDGAGAIHQIAVNTTNITSPSDFGTPQLLVDLNAVFGAGTVAEATRDGSTDYLEDGDAFAKVGKTSFGDIEVIGDTLYVVELSQKKLYGIPLDQTPDASNIQVFDIPNPLSGETGDRADDIRPFGLGVNDGKLFVGMVDSAENSTATDPTDDLKAIVWGFDPATETFDASSTAEFDLNYDRGTNNDSNGAEWQPWSDNFSDVLFPDGVNAMYSQPILSDIEFDNGSMILGLRDRIGDQMGEFTPHPDGVTGGQYSSRTAGELLRLGPDGSGGFTLENDGSVPDGFGGTLSSSSTVGGSSPQGPGGREFYTGDSYQVFGHEEVNLGALVQLPGQPEVMSTTFDPIYNYFQTDTGFPDGDTVFDAGVRRLSAIEGNVVTPTNQPNGLSDGEYRVFNGELVTTGTNANFGKQGGLGDIEAILDAAPVEVGNRIFVDKDGDGIQDANEPGITGVTVRLFDSGGTEIDTTTTDAEGKYSFGGVNTPDLLAANTDYEIRIDDGAGTPLENYQLTLQDVNSNGGSDRTDSDAVDNAGTPTISFTTGEAGENNFTLDAGFTPDVTLVGWIDFDRSGTFDPNEAVTLDTDNGLNTDGTVNTLEFAVPADVEPGETAARFRVASGLDGANLSDASPNGAAPDGEVEDYIVNLVLPIEPPIIDLDGDDSDMTGNDYQTTYVVGDIPVAIADEDVLITDADDDNLQSASIKLAIRADGDAAESLVVNGTLPTGITGSAYDPVTGILELTGDAPISDYQIAIAQIEYTNSIGYHPSDRLVEVTVNDGISNSNTASTTIELDFLPSIDLDGDNSSFV